MKKTYSLLLKLALQIKVTMNIMVYSEFYFHFWVITSEYLQVF